MAYIGTQPHLASFERDSFNGDGATVLFTLSRYAGDEQAIEINISGITQHTNTYTVTGDQLTFSEAPPEGTDNIEISFLALESEIGVPAPGVVDNEHLAPTLETRLTDIESDITTNETNIIDSDRSMVNYMTSNWTERTPAVANSWAGLCWGGYGGESVGEFVAVSFSGTLDRAMYSIDGTTWTSGTTETDNEWVAVCWGAGTYVAVGNTGSLDRAMTSTDGGANWTTRTTPNDNSWREVTYGNSLFVAVSSTGTNNQVMTSTDGITWTSQTTPGSSSWARIIWAEELSLFIAGASSGDNIIMTSPDGITWTEQTTPDYHIATGVAWSAELNLLVAVGNGALQSKVMTSPDGINWTHVITDDIAWYTIVWSPELKSFVSNISPVLGGFRNRAVAASPDGVNWTYKYDFNFEAAESWPDLAWSPVVGRFVALSSADLMSSSFSYQGS